MTWGRDIVIRMINLRSRSNNSVETITFIRGEYLEYMKNLNVVLDASRKTACYPGPNYEVIEGAKEAIQTFDKMELKEVKNGS